MENKLSKAKETLQEKLAKGIAIDDNDRQAVLTLLQALSDQKQPHTYKSTTHEERFMHIHFPPPVNTTAQPRFIGATIFARKGDGEEGVWYAAVSLCSSADQFSRKAGRASARRRYFDSPMQELSREEKPDFKRLREAILNLHESLDEYAFETFLQRTPDALKTLLVK